MNGDINLPACEFAEEDLASRFFGFLQAVSTTRTHTPAGELLDVPVVETSVSDNPLSPLYVEPLSVDAQKKAGEDFNALGDLFCEMEKTLNGSGSAGWVCPVCGRGIAPGVSICPCRSNAPYNFPPPNPYPLPWPYPNPWWKPLIPPSTPRNPWYRDTYTTCYC